MRTFSRDVTELVRNLVRCNGRDPGRFSASIDEGGRVTVRGPNGAVYYPPEGWTSKFVRHLHNGFFDERVEVHPSAYKA
jgi:hypothetical protein